MYRYRIIHPEAILWDTEIVFVVGTASIFHGRHIHVHMLNENILIFKIIMISEAMYPKDFFYVSVASSIGIGTTFGSMDTSVEPKPKTA